MKKRKKLFKEALLWRQLRHRNILPLLGVDTDAYAEDGSFCMVSPWMKRGTVLQYLSQCGHPTVVRERLLRGAATGLQYLHSRLIVHGDLRGTNIFVDDQGEAVLADFGLAAMHNEMTSSSSGGGGSIRWMAPELHDHERLGLPASTRTLATDRYAFGCLCYELFVLRPPFYSINTSAVVIRVVDGKRPLRPSAVDCDGVGMSDAVWDLTERYWSQDPVDRPGMEPALTVFGENYSAVGPVVEELYEKKRAPVRPPRMSIIPSTLLACYLPLCLLLAQA